jgi:gamma-glutamyltranspeptidase/glutathione hydrolase
MDGTGEPHAGLLTAADLAAWRAGTEAPVSVPYAGLTVCKTGPWGQGPVFLQQLQLLAALGLGEAAAGGAGYIHTVVECAKLAFADREAWYGDPDFAQIPLADLLSPQYAAQRAALVGDSASRDLRPGSPGGRRPVLPGYAAGPRRPAPAATWSGEPTLAHSGDTCHVDAADRFGNLVAATPSGGWLQSSPVIPGLGFCLGTRAQMFTLTPGLPNSLAPGKRPRTTLSPGLALRGGEPYLAFGTPGGDQQDQWALSFFLRHAESGMNLQEAIDAPAFHTRHFPSSFWPRESYPAAVDVEERAGPEVIEGLRARGHEVTVAGPWSLGRVSAVARDGGMLYAGANARGMQGYAAGR